ncbi:ABC transporter permease [Candidatus Clostridium stratigraminis]|uniref:FtsX-like permease family protein n=1 Tax=Candidatus Clostridium stratigraminis TaxID=3381661 RepID=A0ABW8T181_9CLOT
MKLTFIKNLFRDIKKTISRFLSIVIIIAVGVAFYAGVRATSPDMKISADYYFNQNNLMDFKLISTLGLTKEDVQEIGKLKGIKAAEGSHSIDAVFEKDKHSLVLNVNSLPAKDGMNIMRVVNGRMPENSNEAIVEDKFLKDNKLKIGDEIELNSGKDTSILDDLNNNKFKIVGTAQSPLYSSAQRQLSSVGNGSVRGFVYILPTVFKSDVYSEIYVKMSSITSNTSLLNNEDYKKAADEIEKKLKDIGADRGKIRYDEVLKDAESKINDAEVKLETSKKEAADKFAEGYKAIEAAQKKLDQGKIELKNNESLFNKKIADGQKQLSEGKNQLSVSEASLNSGISEAAANISKGIEAKVNEAKMLLDSDPQNESYILQYNSLNGVYEKDIKGKDFYSMYSALKADGALVQINSFFNLDELKNNFDNASTQIAVNKNKLAASEAELYSAKQDGLKKLNDARKKLETGQKELDKNIKELKDEEAKANSKFKDAEAEIQKNKEKLKDIKIPSFYALGRSANIGYETYRQDSDRISNIGKAFPLIFFLVAALVSLTTMTRMVQENRTEIGIFKALGYSRFAIVSHYLIYALIASLTGSLVGLSFAFRLFPPLIMNAYQSLYTIPYVITSFNYEFALQASLIAVLFTTAATVASTLEELREAPASLMRPKAPKSGKTILLERISFIWKRLSFTEKVTARNLFRYKQRLLMTVIGIAACTGLMLTGFGLRSGVTNAMGKQFSKIYKYDMTTSFTKSIDESDKYNIENKVMGISNVKSILFTYSKNATVKNKNNENQDAYIVVPENKEKLNNYIDLTINSNSLKLDDSGVIITEKLSNLVNKKAGDTIEITLNDKVIEAKISAVTEHYLSHFIYMSPDYYKKITGENAQFNGFYGLIKDTSENAENNTSKAITGIEDVGSVSFKNNVHLDYNKSMNSINSVVLILIISAGVLAFVVIYNLTNINISERKRELATIKVLGFYNNELAAYIYRENILLTIIGSIVGIGFGIILNSFVLNAAETNVMMFYKTIDPIYFLYSVLLTILFSAIVNIAMYGKFDKIDMIESLKSAE